MVAMHPALVPRRCLQRDGEHGLTAGGRGGRRFGVVQPNITQLATKGRILIELPGQNNPQRVRELLQGTANLEFWETYENSEIIGYLSEANNLLKDNIIA